MNTRQSHFKVTNTSVKTFKRFSPFNLLALAIITLSIFSPIAHPKNIHAETPETTFYTLEEATHTIFAPWWNDLSPDNQNFLKENTWGIWAIEPGDQNHPSLTYSGMVDAQGNKIYDFAYTYYGSHTTYIGSEMNESNGYNSETIAAVMCHEAAHQAGHPHDTWLYEHQESCWRDVQEAKLKRLTPAKSS